MLTAAPPSKFSNCAQPGPLALRALACCPAACGRCGGGGCERRAGGRASCCTRNVVKANRSGVNDCDAFVATVRIAEIVEVLGINGSVIL